MKKSKKIFLGIIVFSFVVFAAFTVYMRAAVSVEYSLQTLDYDISAFKEYENDKELLFNHFKSCYGISEKRAEKMCEQGNEWLKVELNYKVKNSSCIPVVAVASVSTNKSEVYVCREEQVSFYIGEVVSGDSGEFHTDIIIKKSDFSEETLNSLKLKIFALPVSFEAKFSGFPSLENFVFGETDAIGCFENGEVSYVNSDWYDDMWEHEAEKKEAALWFTEKFLGEYAYYLPVSSTDKLEPNNNSIAISRFFSNGFYNVHKFMCNEKEYVGFSFFDKNSGFKGGLALNALRDDKSAFDNLKIGEADFYDIKALEPACIVFKDGDNFKSCHYFDDKTCIEFTYSAEGFIISKSKPDVAEFFELLINSDMEYIDNM